MAWYWILFEPNGWWSWWDIDMGVWLVTNSMVGYPWWKEAQVMGNEVTKFCFGS